VQIYLKDLKEMINPEILPNNIHLVGIGGDGMSALAGLFIGGGKTVSGSEQGNLAKVKQMALIEEFRQAGCIINFGHRAENLPLSTELVVRSSIIPDDNLEIVRAEELDIPVIKRSVAVGRLMIGKTGISIGGTAGKSSSSAMTGFILTEAGFDPSICIGARSKHFSDRNFRSGAGKFFVAEADEFDRSFLDLNQEAALVTNIFYGDHMDYYRDPESMLQAFKEFIQRSRVCFVRGDDHPSLLVAEGSGVYHETFGFGDNCEWRARDIRQTRGGTDFKIEHRSCQVAGHLEIPGIHNVANMLGVIAMLSGFDVKPEISSEILAHYRGVNRRLEKRGEFNGVAIFDDYGHNKIQIDAALEGLRQFYPEGDIYCVFQPRQFRRTKELLGELTQSFNGVKAIVVLDISKGIGDTEAEVESVSSLDVVGALNQAGKNTVYAPTFAKATEWLESTVKRGDAIITFGTGDPYRATDLLLNDV